MSLVVDQVDSLYNYDNSISAVNLIPGSLYEIKLLFLHKSGRFRAYGVYKSDNFGRIDLSRDAPIRGTYVGARQMGLFESYVPLEDFPHGGYAKYTATEVWNYELQLLDLTGKVLDSVKMVKRFMDKSVKRIEIEEGNIRGTLFIPAGEGPFLGVLDFSGTGGGINEQKGAALASEGFCALTIAFFQYKDLTQDLNSVTLEYFLEAVDWLSSRPYVEGKIGLHANSFGGIAALIIARHSSKISAVVSINAPHALNEITGFKYQGEKLPIAEANMTLTTFRNEVMIFDAPIKTLKMDAESDLHLEEIDKRVPIRLVVSLDDFSTSAVYSANYLRELLQGSGHIVECDYRSGGHLMEPPTFPHHEFCWMKLTGMTIGYGGQACQHGANQSKVWKSTVEFLKKWVLQANSIVIRSRI